MKVMIVDTTASCIITLSRERDKLQPDMDV